MLLPVEAGGTQVSHLACSAIRGRGVPRQSRGAGWLRLPAATLLPRLVALPHRFLRHARGPCCRWPMPNGLILPFGSSDTAAAGRWAVVSSCRAGGRSAPPVVSSDTVGGPRSPQWGKGLASARPLLVACRAQVGSLSPVTSACSRAAVVLNLSF